MMRQKQVGWLLVPTAAGAVALTLMTGTAVPEDQTDQQSIPPHIAAQMAARAAGGGGSGELPPFERISEDFESVVSTVDGTPPMYNVWKRDRDGQVLAELPRNFERQNLFIAYTITGGVPTAGVQFGDLYASWKRFDRRLALIQPNLDVRTTGDAESRLGRERVYTDRVVLDHPIAAQGPNGGVVINMTDLLVGQGTRFFGGILAGANRNLLELETVKAFPRNIELGFKLPLANGRIASIHYSISVIPQNTGYQPRKADPRVGYFTTTYRDIGDPSADTPWTRYINRWHLQKADPSLRLSPPREPIVFYIEHTTPVRYRQWVREGVLAWNKAFEKIGITNAIEVYQQDARTGAHMEKDPADARYNFVLWTNAGMGFAIGPSRVDPRTGQIIDADVVLDEGFISSWVRAWRYMLPEMAMEGFGPETYSWLETRPQWDPRVRMAPASEREDVIEYLKLTREKDRAQRGIHRFGGHPAAFQGNPNLVGDHKFSGLGGRISQVNGMCMHGMAKAIDVALFRFGADLITELDSIDFSRPAAAEAITTDPISGTWEGSIDVPEMGGQISLQLVLSLHSDNSVDGTLESMAGSVVVNGDFDPDSNRLSLTGEAPGMGSVNIDLTVEGETMSGTATAGGQSLDISFRRTSRPEPAGPAPTPDEGVEEPDHDEPLDEEADETEEPAEDPAPHREPTDTLDGLPDWFVGPLLRDLTMHEIGHVLGLRHNFKASTIYSVEEINSPEHQEAGKQISGSVMDYNPININFGDGEIQGDYAMMSIGLYDYWAIEYGYSFDRNLDPILERASEPELIYATDEDTWGPDPRARRFDLGENPLDYADSQMRLAQHLREQILERIVEDGDSWAKARQAYEILLGRHFGAVSTAANWVGGSFVNRVKKGDKDDRSPIEDIDPEQQRRALQFVLDNAFQDEAFGLTSELLYKMTVDKWWDAGGFGSIFRDETWPVHDRIMGIQATAMTMLLNPTTLNRVYDNEFRIDADDDTITLPEMMGLVNDAIWSELESVPNRNFTARRPLISSLRRNLQNEHVKRLIDLSMPNARLGAAQRPISNLSVYQLRQLHDRIENVQQRRGNRLDAYSLAHLDEIRVRINRALDAQFIYNADQIGGGGGQTIIFMREDGTQIETPGLQNLDW